MKTNTIIALYVGMLTVSAQSMTLESIEVTAKHLDDAPLQKEGYLANAPMQKQMTKKEALETAGSNGDAIKALHTFAGVVSTNNDKSSDMYIHGSKPRETQFSLNHLPLGYLFHFGGLHSVVAPEMIDQIDAYLGGFDVSYGAMGAVVDMVPHYPKGEESGHVHMGIYDADFAYDTKLATHTNLFISARRSYFDLFADKILDELDSDSNDARKKTTFTRFPQFYDAQMVLSHTQGDNLFSLEVLTAKDTLKIHDTFNVESDPLAVGKINLAYNFNTIGARWVYLGDDVTSHTLLYRLSHTNNSSFYDANYYVDTKKKEYGLYHETVWNLAEHTVMLGTQLKHINAPTKVHSNTPRTDDFSGLITQQNIVDLDKTFEAKEYTFFAQDIWKLSEDDRLRYGLRFWKTDFQNLGSGCDPRMSYVHHVDKSLELALSVGQYSQRPSSFMQIEGFGNPKIKTDEHSIHTMLSMKKKFSDHSSLLVEPYYKSFKNLAIRDDFTRYEAVGKGEAYGVDVTYKKHIENFDFSLAYTYVHAKRALSTNDTREYTFVGDIPHTLQLSGNYHFSKSWRASFYAKYSSGIPYTPVEGTKSYSYNHQTYVEPVYGEPYSKRLKANYDLDIQISKTQRLSKRQRIEYTLELMNINALFRKNIDAIKYNDLYQEEGVYEQMGFLPALHITYRF